MSLAPGVRLGPYEIVAPLGAVRLLFRGTYRTGMLGLPGYDVSPDGKQFLMVAIDQNFPLSSRVNYILGWTSTLTPAR